MTDFKDALLALASYPDASPDYIIDQSVDIAARLGARISALVPIVVRESLSRSYSHGEWLVDVPNLIDEALGRSADNAKALLDRFERTARGRNVFGERLLEPSMPFLSPDRIVEHARQRDLTILPVPDLIGLDELFNEAVIFGSGHPVILLPAKAQSGPSICSLERVVLAWDFSRAAARALADAMPILKAARSVHVLTFSGDKKLSEHLTGTDLDRHLKLHGVEGAFDVVDLGDRAICDAIGDYVDRRDADLLVMGAFGHSRMMEFVLGGATRSLVKAPPVPVFLSH